jgi:hypothetical protein
MTHHRNFDPVGGNDRQQQENGRTDHVTKLLGGGDGQLGLRSLHESLGVTHSPPHRPWIKDEPRHDFEKQDLKGLEEQNEWHDRPRRLRLPRLTDVSRSG